MLDWLASILGKHKVPVSKPAGRTWFPDEDLEDLQIARQEQRIARESANAAADAVREHMTYLEKALTPNRRPRTGSAREEVIQPWRPSSIHSENSQ